MLANLAKTILELVSPDIMMADLQQLCAFDRYQASLGINNAAEYVANAATRSGLSDVTVYRYPADGAKRWWTFAAPTSWTPTIARLSAMDAGHELVVVDHADQPFSIATYSAMTAEGGEELPFTVVSHNDCSGVAGSVAIVPRASFHTDIVARLSTARARGFVTDGPCSSIDGGETTPGRIELNPVTKLFGFSVSHSDLAQFADYAAQGATARVEVKLDRTAQMPVVQGMLPGDGADGEIWLTAHLCHPRPGANDNASGVVALLEVAATLSALRRGKPAASPSRAIRFIWGPEFLGIVATLNDHMKLIGSQSLPISVINLDMVGEDQTRCGGPMIMERCPDFIPSVLNPLAEEVVALIFKMTSNAYGTWRASEFLGYSDHAIFADSNIRIPAIQITHAPDRFNHSGADSLDKVSPFEMRRSSAVAATLAQLLATSEHFEQAEIASIIDGWCTREMLNLKKVAQSYQNTHLHDWSERLISYALNRERIMKKALVTERYSSKLYKHLSPASSPSGDIVYRNWCGPLNLRALVADLGSQSHAEVKNLFYKKKWNHALLFNIAIRVDGKRCFDEIVNETSFALGAPLEPALVEKFIAYLLESGWVTRRSPRLLCCRTLA
jgi:hypothetical protein